MNEDVLKKTVETVTDKPIHFDIDIAPRNFLHKWLQRTGKRPKKRYFTLQGLTLNQVYAVSGILLELDAGKLTPDDILKLFRQLPKIAEIIAIAVTPSREQPPKELIRFFMHNLEQPELQHLAGIILGRLKTTNFLTTILSLKQLQILWMDKSPQTASETIADPTPGRLSVAS